MKLAFSFSGGCKSLAAVLWLALWSAALATEAEAQTASFTNTTSLILTNGTQVSPQKASLYPSTISFAGFSGVISKVTVQLNSISTPGFDPGGINAMLVSPSGAKLVFVAHPGDGTVTFSGATLAFDDFAAADVPGCNTSSCSAFASGTLPTTNKPTAWLPPEVSAFPSPAPAAPNLPQPDGYATLASTFNGTTANGTWSLYVMTDATVGSPNGTIAGGWTLTITTLPGDVPTATTISSTLNPSYTSSPSNSVSFTATVTSNSVSIGTNGTVTFSDSGTTLVANVALNVAGQATFTTTTLSEGAHKIIAAYSDSGSSVFGPSSASLSQVVIDHSTSPAANEFCNSGNISIPESGLTGSPAGDPANPYPSSLFVSGVSGTISNVYITLNGITHTHPNDMEMLLVTPNGAAYAVWSAVAAGDPVASSGTITLTDTGATQLPATGGTISSGNFRPAVYNTNAPVFPAPAPASFSSAAPFGTVTLAQAFNGLNPNGTWSLYVVDDQGGNTGSIPGGWCLTFNSLPIVTQNPVADAVCPGATATFTSVAAGTPTPTVQWQTDSSGVFTNIPGATSTTLAFTASAAQNGTQYRAVFNNSGGGATSTVATLTIDPAPVAPTITPSPASVCPNSAGNQASGPAGVASYAWVVSNGSITSATNLQTITYTAGPSGNVGLNLVVANSFGCTATNSTSVTIIPSTPVIMAPSAVCAGSSGNIASGPAGSHGFAWTILNGVITSATNAQTITFTAASTGSVVLELTAVNSSGCTGSTSAVVSINPLPIATITPTPASVPANSPGNIASAPGGMGGYAWTIDNGVITSATNTPYITYVAGPSGDLTLGLTVSNANADGCTGSTSITVPIILNPPPVAGWSFRTNYFPSITFTDALPATFTVPTIAFDGTNYWAGDGGFTSGLVIGRYDTNGVLLGSFSSAIDFRSVFTDASGAVFARAYNDPTIYLQTAPGTFAPSGVTLTGGTINSQGSVVLNGAGTEYDAVSGGVVSRWDPAGNYLGTVNLIGFGSVTNETSSLPARGLAAFGNFWLTYNGSGILSVWDFFGNRLAMVTLASAGTNTSSDYSFSYCNGKVFVLDTPGGLWRGYDVGNSGRVGIFGAPSTTTWNSDVQSKIAGTGLIPQVDAFLASTSNYGLADLRRYEAVLAYTDAGFLNQTNMGNALASLVDLGGGAVISTFAYNPGYLTGGNITNTTYMPFTLASQSASSGLTLVEDVPTHPILNGVTSFNGGTSGYHELSAITSGTTQVAHWSSGSPLIGARDVAPGRVAGLNFYPPSSDARSDFWVSSTSGGLIMANALLWAGKAPPTIVTGPSNQVSGVGGTVNYSVSAVGLPPLTYQWHRNGTNIPGANASTLSVLVQPNSAGQYSVVVSNVYGIAISKNAALNPPIQFFPALSPASIGAYLPLYLGTVDGSPLTVDRAARIQVYTSLDVTTPFSLWTQLTGPLVLTNGMLRVDGIGLTNSRSFFRAVETQ